MTHILGTIWIEWQGSRKVWKLQAPRGILTFRRKCDALNWQRVWHPEVSRA